MAHRLFKSAQTVGNFPVLPSTVYTQGPVDAFFEDFTYLFSCDRTTKKDKLVDHTRRQEASAFVGG